MLLGILTAGNRVPLNGSPTRNRYARDFHCRKDAPSTRRTCLCLTAALGAAGVATVQQHGCRCAGPPLKKLVTGRARCTFRAETTAALLARCVAVHRSPRPGGAGAAAALLCPPAFRPGDGAAGAWDSAGAAARPAGRRLPWRVRRVRGKRHDSDGAPSGLNRAGAGAERNLTSEAEDRRHRRCDVAVALRLLQLGG